MEKFDGSNTAITEWWVTFITYITLHNIKEATAIKMLPFYLLGIAHQWFLHLDAAFKTSLTKVEEAFYQRFKPTAPISKAVLKVQQLAGEKVDNYVYRVRQLAADSVMEEKVVTFFAMEGLLPQLRDHCHSAKPPDTWKNSDNKALLRNPLLHITDRTTRRLPKLSLTESKLPLIPWKKPWLLP